MTDRRVGDLLVTGFLALLALLSLVGFHDAGRQYLDYPMHYGIGINNITAQEIVFYAWYLVYGSLAVALLTAVLCRMSLFNRAEGVVKRVCARGWIVPVALFVLLAEVLIFQGIVLEYMPVADDEDVYAFIAKTLLRGNLANPSPGDVEFFQNKFVVLNGGLWYGKYPLGYPLLLALGELLDLRFLVTPLITCATLIVTHRVGALLFSSRQANLAVLLLLLSPHFVFMAATELSHSAMTLFVMLGLLATLKVGKGASIWWALLAGIAWGYGILIRPLPGVLFVPVLGVWMLFFNRALPWRQRLRSVALGAVPVLASVALIFVFNKLLTGDGAQSSYHLAHASQTGPTRALSGLGLFTHTRGVMGTSFGAALLRQNFWLFGWPLSLLFVPFARPGRQRFLFWGILAAIYSYRFVAPKTCVATLGPVYVTEAVPLLALATASGAVQVRRYVKRLQATFNPAAIGGLMVASTIVALCCFVPVQLRGISRGAQARSDVLQLVEKTVGEDALVFADFILPPQARLSWAIHPPNPSPSLDDPIVYVRPQHGPDGALKNIEFWERRFPKRSAWMLYTHEQGVRVLPVGKHN